MTHIRSPRILFTGNPDINIGPTFDPKAERWSVPAIVAAEIPGRGLLKVGSAGLQWREGQGAHHDGGTQYVLEGMWQGTLVHQSVHVEARPAELIIVPDRGYFT